MTTKNTRVILEGSLSITLLSPVFLVMDAEEMHVISDCGNGPQLPECGW